ncbi:AMP-binding protein [Allosalinactinospora lopnorensis]|uniref:AMP-binding protein n=1 Tax=Allosalinactinospora lopnorensis TaxID=1352348 RepID=UPI000623C039|nr:AMP-binding protein [Allosalinactinospora lopnorensis]
MTGNPLPRSLAPPHTRDTGAEPIGTITGGLLDRLRRRGGNATVSDSRGPATDAVAFASTIERAATGLGRRGVCPGDVVGVLAPVSPVRLTAVYTVMAVGGIALPLELASDRETQIDVLTETDARLLLVTASLAGTALGLAERSRVRQVIAFGEAPETTPFEELLLPGTDSGGYDPARGLFNNGILDYQATSEGVVTTLYGHTDLLNLFRRFGAELELSRSDVVAVEPGMAEPARTALAALALWQGVSVVTTAAETEPEIRRDLAAACATVRGAPVPTRMAARG